MKSIHALHPNWLLTPKIAFLAAALVLSGCATRGSGDRTGNPVVAKAGSENRFTATDGRKINIGAAAVSDGGLVYANPHMERGKCWLANGFNFTGFDTLYLAPVTSTAKFPDKPADTMVHKLASENLVIELNRRLGNLGLFSSVVTRESDIRPGSRVLTMENTITEFSKGGGGARFWAGEFGAGQPVLRVSGKVTDGTKTLFSYEARRSGVSAGARMVGSFMKDEDIQIEDIRSMVLDLSDFVAAVAGKYQPRN